MKISLSRTLALASLTLCLTWVVGCGGCDETTGTEYQEGDVGYGDVGLDTSTTDTSDDASEQPDDAGDEVDDDATLEGEPCEQEGETRNCGTDVGQCEYGEQVCEDGTWSECEGAVGPEPERCDGLDNNCSGEADDGTGLCGDTVCAQNGSCVDGECQYEDGMDCSQLDSPCTVGTCDAKAGGCVEERRDDGTECDDGDFCTVGGTCQDGVCESEPRDCSELDSQCSEGICRSDIEECVAEPINQDQSCDDGNFCTVDTVCDDGQCVGSERDCSAFDDQCNDAVCDEDAEECKAEPVDDQTSCSNGLYCTVDDYCLDGECVAGDDRDCSAAGGSCRAGDCDEDNNTCTGEPVEDGTSCYDGDFCTVDGSCQDGECELEPRDCSHLDTQCSVGVCSSELGECVAEPINQGESCSDGLFCTENTVCDDGQCVGDTIDCSHAGDQCNEGVCDEEAEECVPEPVQDGTYCDDELYCTVDNECQDGQCVGSERDCTGEVDTDNECTVGVCDEDDEECVAEPVEDGTTCDDGYFCTIDETCDDGECVGEPYDCEDYEDDCHEATCVEDDNECDVTNICDPCADDNPVADAGDDREVAPNTDVLFDGSDSYDPNDQDLSYDWWIESAPDGSDANLQDSNSETPWMTADVAGTFEICLNVTNEDGCVSDEPDCVTVEVIPDVDLHIELTWPDDPGVDLDVHYRTPDGEWFDRETGGPPGQTADCGEEDHQASAVWFCVPNPGWGDGADGSEPDGNPDTDPILDIDSLEGEEPENINQQELFDGEGFRVGVHHWDDNGYGPEEGRVRIYIGGQLEFEEYHTLECGEFWEVADIDVSDDGTDVEISSHNKETLDADEVDTGLSAPCN